jgi:alanyl-tRNA synthetase
MGGRSGISLIEVSKSDQDILVQAGLRPILKRLSQTHGFTVDVVAEVYQETGSLKDTEDTLERMKHSAEKTRVSISRRRSTLGILSGEQREPVGRGSPEASQTNNDYLNWDTSRMGSRILFGASP